MNKKSENTKSQKKDKRLAPVTELLEQLAWLFGINNWEKKISIVEDKDNVSAQITVDEKYQRILVEIFSDFWRQDKEKQREILLHEMCHTIVYPVVRTAEWLKSGNLISDDDIDFQNEKATCKVEHIINFFLTSDTKYIKDAYKKYLS